MSNDEDSAACRTMEITELEVTTLNNETAASLRVLVHKRADCINADSSTSAVAMEANSPCGVAGFRS